MKPGNQQSATSPIWILDTPAVPIGTTLDQLPTDSTLLDITPPVEETPFRQEDQLQQSGTEETLQLHLHLPQETVMDTSGAPLETLEDLVGHQPAKTGLPPMIGDLPCQSAVTDLYNSVHTDKRLQTSNIFNYEPLLPIDNTLKNLEQVSNSTNYCAVVFTNTNIGGTSKQQELVQQDQKNQFPKDCGKTKGNYLLADKQKSLCHTLSTLDSSFQANTGASTNDEQTNYSHSSNNLLSSATLKKKTYADTVAPQNIKNKISNSGYGKDCAVIMERLQGTSIDTYIEAIWDTIKEKAITYIGQSPEDPNIILAFVKTPQLANILIREGIQIGWKWIKVSAMEQPAIKIVISGVLPFISDDTISEQLSKYGRLAYQEFKRIPAATKTSTHKGILSYRREAFIIPENGKYIPERITILNDTKLYTLEVSYEGPKCFKCEKRGHTASRCGIYIERKRSLNAPVTSVPTHIDINYIKPQTDTGQQLNLTSEEEQHKEEWKLVAHKKKILKTDTVVASSQHYFNLGEDETQTVPMIVLNSSTVKRKLTGEIKSDLNINQKSILEKRKSKTSITKQPRQIVVNKTLAPKTFITQSSNLAGQAAIMVTRSKEKDKHTTNPSININMKSPFDILKVDDKLKQNETISVEGLLSNNDTTNLKRKDTYKSIIENNEQIKLMENEVEKDKAQEEKSEIHSKMKVNDEDSYKKEEKQWNTENMNNITNDHVLIQETNDQPKNENEKEIKLKNKQGIEEKEKTQIEEDMIMDTQTNTLTEEVMTTDSQINLNVHSDNMNNKVEIDQSIQSNWDLMNRILKATRHLKAFKRKEVVKKYRLMYPRLKEILIQIAEDNLLLCSKGSAEHKRILQIIRDISEIESRTQRKVEVDNKVEIKSSMYTKEHPPNTI